MATLAPECDCSTVHHTGAMASVETGTTATATTTTATTTREEFRNLTDRDKFNAWHSFCANKDNLYDYTTVSL